MNFNTARPVQPTDAPRPASPSAEEYAWSIRPEGELVGVNLAPEQTSTLEVQRLFKKLEDLSLDRDCPVPQELKKFLELIDDPAARTLIIEGLRLNEPKVFSNDSARVACFLALANYCSDPSVIQVCAEELQTHRTNQVTTQAAFDTLRDLPLSNYPNALAILNNSILDIFQKPAIPLSELSPGASKALALLAKHDSNALTSTLVEQTLSTYRSGKDCSTLIEALNQVDTDKAKLLLYGMATKVVFNKLDWRMSGYDRANQIIGMAWLGTNIILDITAAISLTVSRGPVGIPLALLPSFGVLVASTLIWVGVSDKLLGRGLVKEDANSSMSEKALLALQSYLPDNKIEALYLSQAQNKKLSQQTRTELTRAIVNKGSQESLKGYLDQLDSGDSQTKIQTIRLIANRTEPWVVSAITKATMDTDPEVRVEATRAVKHWRK